MKKIILTILLIFPFFVNASSMYQEIDILENGDLKVKESISIDGEYNGFELTLKYKYYDENKVFSADDLEIIKVCESEKNNPLANIKECFNEVTSANKGDSLKYVHTKTDGLDTIRMYNPSKRQTAFYIEYILKNVIVNHEDINELKLNMIDGSFSESLDLIQFKVTLPSRTKELRAWAHGPLWGNIKLDHDRQFVIFEIQDYESYTPVDIRVAFDKEIVNTNKKTNTLMLDEIVAEETLLADEANKYREELKKEEENYKKFIEKQNKKFKIFSGAWIIIGLLLLYNYYIKYDKEHDSLYTSQYFREFPSKHSPEIVEYLMKNNISTIGLSSSLLNIIYKKGFLVEKKTRETGIIRKKQVDDFELTLNDENLKEELTDNEKRLRNMFVDMFGEDNKFRLSDLDKIGNSESKSRKFISKYNQWKNEAIEESKKENFYESTGNKKVLLILYGVIGYLIFGYFIQFNSFALIIAILATIFIIYIACSKKRTREGNELYNKWNGLKNFIKDFGNFNEKELPEIVLWEKYLVYAHVFGLADELRKQMEVKIPNISEESTFNTMTTYDYIMLNNAINKSVTRSVSAAVTNANSKIASSNASSGSGYGGGFSGGSSGGGFSGGGGSGGGRF